MLTNSKTIMKVGNIIKPKNGSFLCPIGWVVKVYGKSKLDYLSNNLISNDTWWDLMEEYGKYVERSNFRKNKT
jgi:hypothetical protein